MGDTHLILIGFQALVYGLRSMSLVTRFTLWIITSSVALITDMVTKSVPHTTVAHNGAHTPPLLFFLVGCFLCVLGVWHSRLLAIGSGLMFGGLCGNAGQLLVTGYATDWIPVGGWLTNIADISGAVGLVCCFAGYTLAAVRRHAVERQVLEI